MNLIFMGSPVFAVPALQAVQAAGHHIVAVYTQPPRPAGRKGVLTPTPVHQAAEAMGLKVRHPERLKDEALDDLMATPCDAIVVVGYGLILPKRVVDERLCLNVHPSALPRWRGPTPVQSVLMAGEPTTDVCVMRLEAGMDTGPVYSRTTVPVPPDMTAGELNGLVWPLGASKLVEVLAALPNIQPVEQQGEATYGTKITPDIRALDFSLSAREVHNKVRALAPTPGATALVAGETIKVLRTQVVAETGQTAPAGTVVRADDQLHIACGEGVIGIQTLQRAGKTPMEAEVALRGWNVE
ncbi:MAG: methionyl-tRNA formyltransferase [Pseudomonadaceae bacterium]|nr:methionyl-tRNA formyltransferase [Pseudomonadaceae bacterium]